MDARNRSADRLVDRRGGPDERARPPEELLDNLRLRLSRLAGNHPSAPHDRPARHGDGADTDYPVGEPAAGGQPEDGTGRIPSGRADAVPGGQDGRSAESARAGEAVRATATAAAAGMAALATMELPGRTRRGEAYRPWFMAGEPGSPWWSGALH